MDWQDALANEVRELEANGCDIASGDRARSLLKIIRGYETRVRQLALRIADAQPRTKKPLPASGYTPRKPSTPSKPLYRTFDADIGAYLDDPLGAGKK